VPGRAEQNPQVWVDAVAHVLGELGIVLKASDHILGGVGVSGQQHGMVALSADFTPLRHAKLWCDVEASSEATEISEQATTLLETSISIPPGFTIPKVLWMKRNEPDLFSKLRWCILPHDYINLLLCHGPNPDSSGSIVPTTDAGDASGTGIFDAKTRTFDRTLAAALLDDDSFPDKLPRVLGPNECAGTLHNSYKRLLRIPLDQKEKVVVSAGSGDNMMSALGTNCVEPGVAVLSLGTSGTLFGVSETPVTTGTAVAAFCDATGRHFPLACVMSCTAVLQTVLQEWCPLFHSSHDEASQAILQIEPGTGGITFLPYIGGERTPDWPQATGSLLGLTSSNFFGHDTKAQQTILYRAAMEGISYNIAMALDELRAVGFCPQSKLLVVGGGSKNRIWLQMLADILGLSLELPLEAESAALGAALQAGAAATNTPVDQYVLQYHQKEHQGEESSANAIITPTTNKSTTAAYKEGFDRFKSLSNKLFNS